MSILKKIIEMTMTPSFKKELETIKKQNKLDLERGWAIVEGYANAAASYEEIKEKSIFLKSKLNRKGYII